MKSPLHIAKLLYWRHFVPGYLRAKGVTLRGEVAFTGAPIVSMVAGSEISIGARCSVISVAGQTALGVNHPVIIRTLRKDAGIHIGDDTGISGGVICAAKSVSIGSGCLIGANVIIFDTDFHPVRPVGRRYNNCPEDVGVREVVIRNNVFIGTGSIVSKGVEIGENSIIGAGSVVVDAIPPNVIAAGNPARVIRKIESF